ncbi:MAG: DUF1512 domain-containing protein [Thaumarchaeota archaeon]|nr:MAG: DUF1512 domain-containing protein [Nitrososphaerota archaeon]
MSWLFQFAGGQDLLSILMSLFWFIFMLIFLIYPTFSQKIQLSYMLRDVEKKLLKLKYFRDEVRKRTIDHLNKYSDGNIEVDKGVDRLLGSVVIEPIDRDPYGIMYKLEHIVNTWEETFENEVKALCPKADEKTVKTLTNLVEVARGLDYIYRIIRHYYLLGKKTANIYTVLQVQMILPQVMEIANAYRQASYAFAQGQPIGDGVGVLAVAKLVDGMEKKTYEIAKDTIVQEAFWNGRKLLVLRAKGPGGAVGKPGEGVKKLIEAEGDRVKAVITIDAGLKLEGEESGKIIEGVGAAIGGIGVERYKIEEISKAKGIPLYAFVIYESIAEAITPMRENIAKAAEKVVEKIKNLILEKIDDGATVIVAGIGNTVGIGIT